MKQSKKDSLIESLSNTFIGVLTSLVAQMILYPLYGLEVSLFINLQLTFWFTLISIIRGYVIRRFFNKK